MEAHTLHVYAETLIALNHLNLAKEKMQSALTLRRELNQESHHFLPPLLGLAYIAHLQGNHDAARRDLKEVMDQLATHTLNGLGDPFGFYWLCYKLLNYYQDARANTLIEDAYQQLQLQGDSIPDEISREAFFQHVPENHFIIQKYKQLHDLS
jgi:ATP/maltotriose-dependent transcriptional regulator MalT